MQDDSSRHGETSCVWLLMPIEKEPDTAQYAVNFQCARWHIMRQLIALARCCTDLTDLAWTRLIYVAVTGDEYVGQPGAFTCYLSIEL